MRTRHLIGEYRSAADGSGTVPVRASGYACSPVRVELVLGRGREITIVSEGPLPVHLMIEGRAGAGETPCPIVRRLDIWV